MNPIKMVAGARGAMISPGASKSGSSMLENALLGKRSGPMSMVADDAGNLFSPGASKSDRKALATELNRGKVYNPIKAGAAPASGFGAGYTAAAGVGGMFGAFADSDNRMRGAVAGATGGMLGGKALRSFGSRGAGVSNSVFGAIDNKMAAGNWGAMGDKWRRHRGVVHKGLRGFHSSEGRNNMFRSGAMLGGGAFGLMFASNGRSHKRGFNSKRGNSFTR